MVATPQISPSEPMPGTPPLHYPDWPAPPTVHAWTTTRLGGCGTAPFDTFNLSATVGDPAVVVEENRRRLRSALPQDPVWLTQVHGCTVLQLDADSNADQIADASVTRLMQRVCVVTTADCLPILLCDVDGCVVAAVHAGWRGLAQGVIEATVHAMACPPNQLLAWLGPAIGPHAFMVGSVVYETFVGYSEEAAHAFKPAGDQKWFGDLYALARQRLGAIGVQRIYGGECCTYLEPHRFFSYRRDGQTGRMASLIWLDRDNRL